VPWAAPGLISFFLAFYKKGNRLATFGGFWRFPFLAVVAAIEKAARENGEREPESPRLFANSFTELK
jgi:hypothetical protein